jgi:hypothetical protein
MMIRFSLGTTTTDINMQPQDDMKNIDSSDCQRAVVVSGRSPISPAEQIQIDEELDKERKIHLATSLEKAVDSQYYMSTNSSVSSLEGSSSEYNGALVVPEDSDDHSLPVLAKFRHHSMPSLADIGNEDHEDIGSFQEPECTLNIPTGSNPSLVGMGPSRKESRWAGQRGRSDSLPCNPRRAGCDNHNPNLTLSPGQSQVHVEPGTSMDVLPTNRRRSSFDDISFPIFAASMDDTDLGSSLHTSSHHRRSKSCDQFENLCPTHTDPTKSSAEINSAGCADHYHQRPAARYQRRKSFDEIGDFLPTNPRMKVPGGSGSPEQTGHNMSSRRSSMQSRRSSCDTLPMVPLRGSYYEDSDHDDASVEEEIEAIDAT